MNNLSNEELRRMLYAAIKLTHIALDSEWTGSEDSLKQLIISNIGISEEMFDAAIKE